MDLRTPLAVGATAVAALVSVAAGSAAGTARPADPAAVERATAFSQRDWVPGELLVRFRAGVTRTERTGAHAVRGGRVALRVRGLATDLVRLPRGVSVREALARYRADPRVASAEPNALLRPLEVVPNDALFNNLWSLRNTAQDHPLSDPLPAEWNGELEADIDASDAWAVQPGSASTIIAVVDSGVDVSHPDLAGNIWVNGVEAAGTPGVDDDANGYVDDVNGWDFAQNDGGLLAPSTAFSYDHGTHVAGTIAATMNDATGVAGVCPGCKLMVLKVMRDDGVFTASAVIQALAYAKAMGAHVVNLSLGGPAWSNLMREAIRTGGFLAVVAAGNNSLDNDMSLAFDADGDGSPDTFSPAYPASYTLPNILSVAASNHRDEYGYETGCFLRLTKKRDCAFSNWGHDAVDLAAPGVDVTSTVPGNAYATFNGTSMAAPHVAGVAGLVKSQHPEYTPLQLKNAVMNAVERPSSLKVLYTTLAPFSKSGSFTRTSGRVNAFSALTAATSNATPLTDGNINGARAMTTTSVSRSIRWPDDVNDVYRRKLYKGKKYRLVLDGPIGKDFDLFVWRPGTKEIWQTCPTSWSCRLVRRSARGGTADEAVTFTAGATAVYYFHVGAWLFNGGSYKLTIRRL